MILRNKTHRTVDGEWIPGTWRPIFIRNGGSYYSADLFVYADGSIYCWEWVDLDGFREKVRTGWVATTLEPGASASMHGFGSWRIEDPRAGITPEGLVGEVADLIDRLNDRPDSAERCLQVLGRYLETRSEEDRVALSAAFDAIPEHQRMYVLGDMDAKDFPLRALCTEPGGRVHGFEVTEEMRERAFGYFATRFFDTKASRERTYPDGPRDAEDPTLHLNETVYPHGWPADAGTLVLRNEFPSPIEVGGHTYPTVEHAYWALSTDDPAARASIRGAERIYDVRNLAYEASRRPGWPAARVAVMAGLLRAKFDRHPAYAEVLLATGDGRIEYSTSGSEFWSVPGRNWVGRLLETVRSELAARRAGFPEC